MSETDQCRERLAPYCKGCGLDIGFGGSAIVPWAICMDMPKPYTKVGESPQHLSGTCTSLHWFQNRSLDFIYSSHLLEDFTYSEQVRILKEWMRVIKRNGKIILYQPDQAIYANHCRATGQPYNQAHKEPDYSLQNFKNRVLPALGSDMKIIHEIPLVEIYSWEIVLEKDPEPVF